MKAFLDKEVQADTPFHSRSFGSPDAFRPRTDETQTVSQRISSTSFWIRARAAACSSYLADICNVGQVSMSSRLPVLTGERFRVQYVVKVGAVYRASGVRGRLRSYMVITPLDSMTSCTFLMQ
ncbi:hypothetical protein PV04_09053 [Phialophora macrospora]|uniref:Uncharacterized protein n=1 Tax=Phialophora macrospora TaxID=1851006 RepID=A0A0D2FB81_9EURO|nr:hypothetical protein PV04_09053 [Phialophora macrospora]